MQDIKEVLNEMKREIKEFRRENKELHRMNKELQRKTDVMQHENQSQFVAARITQLKMSRVGMINTLVQVFQFARKKETDQSKQHDMCDDLAQKHNLGFMQRMREIMFGDIKEATLRYSEMKKLLCNVDTLRHERNCIIHLRSLEDLLKQTKEYASIIKYAADQGDDIPDEFQMMFRVFSNVPEFVKAKIGNFNPPSTSASLLCI